MARLIQVICDGCGDVLKGTKGTVGINKDNFAILGMITYFDGDGDYIHITKRADESMNFCNTECFKSFCNRRMDEYRKRRTDDLKKEVEDDIVFNRRKYNS